MDGIPPNHVRIARVVGESKEGLTLFVPKDMGGIFHLEGGERFLTLFFARNTEVPGEMVTWLPWED